MVGANVRANTAGSGATLVVIVAALSVASCSSRTTLEELEDEAIITGEWEAVERREERTIEWLEASAPHCVGPFNKVCVEEQTGIECYCVPKAEND